MRLAISHQRSGVNAHNTKSFFGRTKMATCTKSLAAPLPAQEESKKELEKEKSGFFTLTGVFSIFGKGYFEARNVPSINPYESFSQYFSSGEK